MFKLQCSHCGMEMLIPKNQKMILECPKCGGHLEIIEALSEEKQNDFYRVYPFGEQQDWYTNKKGYSDYDINDFGFGNITITYDGKNSTSENYWVYA